MQTETLDGAANETAALHPSMESVYRTKWLIAHNCLHKIAHDHPDLLKGEWDGYLSELESAEAIASKLA